MMEQDAKIFPEYSSCRDGSDWLSIRRSVMSKLGSWGPYLPLPLPFPLHSSYAKLSAVH